MMIIHELTSEIEGTFARVWLSCLAGSRKEGQKVFALKILRKADSKPPQPGFCYRLKLI